MVQIAAVVAQQLSKPSCLARDLGSRATVSLPEITFRLRVRVPQLVQYSGALIPSSLASEADNLSI